MTTKDRLVVLDALWMALHQTRALSKAQPRRAVNRLRAAVETIYNAHGDVRAAEAYEQGRTLAAETLASVREDGYRAGMLAVERRADRRDLFEIGDPEELRSIH